MEDSRPTIDGIQAKLDRADEHLETLDRAIDTYLAPPKPYVVCGEEYTERGKNCWTIFLEVREFPPDEEWGPLIGDFVHNLRSALDHLAWQVALPEVRAANPTSIEFPVSYPKRDAKTKAWIAKEVGRFRPEAQAIIERAQPYETRDRHHPLWLLQKLWNTDKHRTIHTAGFMLDHSFGASNHPLNLPMEWTHGRLEARTQSLGGGRSPHPIDLGHEMQVWDSEPDDVTFGVVGELPSAEYPYEGLPVRRVLRRLQEILVREAIDPLREVLAAHGTPRS